MDQIEAVGKIFDGTIGLLALMYAPIMIVAIPAKSLLEGVFGLKEAQRQIKRQKAQDRFDLGINRVPTEDEGV